MFDNSQAKPRQSVNLFHPSTGLLSRAQYSSYTFSLIMAVVQSCLDHSSRKVWSLVALRIRQEPEATKFHCWGQEAGTFASVVTPDGKCTVRNRRKMKA